MAESVDLLVRNARILDPDSEEIGPPCDIAVRSGVIAEISRPFRGSATREIGAARRVALPGLIDAHVHVLAHSADLAYEAQSPFYVAARAVGVLRGMLDRGFTTVRDAGGADFGIARAVEEGYLVGPRIRFGGKAITQTGGHGDHRPARRNVLEDPATCPTLSQVADGVDAVRKTARNELRRGAHHLKLMLSGGVASPTDSVHSIQFSTAEIRAAVEEAQAAGRYVLGHAYTARAINRALECGVRSIEHGNLLDDTSIELFLRTGAFYVPTLSTYRAMAEEGREDGLPERYHTKVFDVLDAGLRSLEAPQRAGVRIAYGTDLLGRMHRHQLREITIRAEVQPPADVLRSATTTAAELLGLDGLAGRLIEGAYADILLLDGDPLQDISLLTDPDEHLHAIVHNGRVHRNRTS